MSRKLLIGPVATVGVVVLLIVAYGGCRYNSLVNGREDVRVAWANVESSLQRRADLIPNLVATVKGIAAHEQEVFTAVADARSRLLGARGPAEASEASGQMESALGRLLAIGERYPELRSAQNFIALQDQLEGTENRVKVARDRYNEAAGQYNRLVNRFPSRIFAGMFGFEAADYFEAEPTAREAPRVEF
jgi:LemA protein